MGIPFYKMSGAGNDFIFIDNRKDEMKSFGNIKDIVVKACARNVSVGADGLVLIENAENGADFKWEFYNSDGSVAEMCGNASRCAGRFAFLQGIAGEKMKFETLAGVIEAEIKEGVNVKVQLTAPFDERSDYQLELDGETVTVSSINTGVPHVCYFVDDIENMDIMKYGSAVRYHDEYAPAGTNFNFCAMTEEGQLRVRTYERGVEGETMACGTGAVACSIFAIKKGLVKSPVTVKTSSGLLLKVYVEGEKVYLEGEARVVYKGELTNEAYEY
jgi:diaminopimelate epimerase